MNLEANDPNEMTVISDGPVILSVPIDDEAHCIMYIYTPPALRGQGKMRKMFKEQMRKADKTGRRFFLLLSPDADTDEDRLRAFYEEQGFEFGEDYPHNKHAIRLPKEA